MAKSKTRIAFDKAFREARNMGDRRFVFQGKFYNTMTGEEVKSGKTQSRQSKEHEEFMKQNKPKKIEIKKIPTQERNIHELITINKKEDDKKDKKQDKEPRYKRRIKRILEKGEKKESRQADNKDKRN